MAGIMGCATLTVILARNTGGCGLVWARPAQKNDVQKWVLQNFTAAEHQSWLDRLLTAVSDEAERLATGDPQGFASRVAYLSPAPHNNDGPDYDKTDEG